MFEEIRSKILPILKKFPARTPVPLCIYFRVLSRFCVFLITAMHATALRVGLKTLYNAILRYVSRRKYTNIEFL